jgi:hypothetical protein
VQNSRTLGLPFHTPFAVLMARVAAELPRVVTDPERATCTTRRVQFDSRLGIELKATRLVGVVRGTRAGRPQGEEGPPSGSYRQFMPAAFSSLVTNALAAES